ncbi:g3182 [Coccomyxa elongata]
MQNESCPSLSRLSPIVAATVALLCAALLVGLQALGDPELMSALMWGSAAHDRHMLHPHGTAATFGVQDVSMGLMSEVKKEEVSADGKGVQLALAPTLAVPDALPHKEKMGLVGVKEAAAPSPAASAGNSSVTGDAVLEEIGGTEVVYTRVAAPKAVLLLFHGCSHSARDWGRNSSTCPGCLGLPEEMAIVKTSLARSYVPLAFSSSDKSNRCWDAQWLDKSVDIPNVRETFQKLAARERWEKLPVYALGASSGASMVLFLALRMPLDGIVPQIMSLPPHMLEAKPTDPAAGKSWTYPPVYFVHMELDRATAQRVTADINVLKTKQGAWVTEKLIRPRPVTPELFSGRIEGIDVSTAGAIYKALKKAQLLNATDFLKEDPRVTLTKWQPVLKAIPAVAGIGLVPETSPIFEELNLAWARHELISDHLDEVLDWLDARRRDGSAKLLAAVKPRQL